MTDNGWVKIHRKMLENPAVMKDPDHLAVWVWLLANVTHKDKKVDFAGQIIGLKPGQLTCGRQQIAEGSKVNEWKVERIIKLFKSEQQIAQQTTNKCRLITINNWNEYQENAQQNAQPVHNNCTTTAQQLHTKQEDKELKNINYKDTIVSSADAVDEKENNVEKVEVKKTDKRDPMISKMILALKGKVGIDAFVDSTIERNIAKHCCGLMEKLGKDEFVRRLDCLLADKFHQKNCNKIKYIYNNIKGFIEPKTTVTNLSEYFTF